MNCFHLLIISTQAFQLILYMVD